MELGQREELLESAARPGEQVTVGVSGEMQTVILEAGARAVLNFNNFVREASMQFPEGDPAENLTVTVTRQLLDESGVAVPGPVEVLSPSEDRVSVSIDMEFEQYFVDIADAVVGDSGVYTIEVCSQTGTPDEVCFNASTRVFTLDCELHFPNTALLMVYFPMQ